VTGHSTEERIAALSPSRQLLIRRRLAEARAARTIPPADRTGRLPLSYAQLRLWFLDQLDPGLPTYKLPWALRMRTPIDADRLRAALRLLVSRHEILRTRYLAEDGVPYQVVDPPPADVPLTVVDLPAEALEERVREQTRRPVDLAAGPALTALLLRLDPQDHVLLLDLHHISTDGWSTPILLRELLALYRGAALPPLPLQYADFAAWQRDRVSGAELDRQLGYWRTRLAGLPTLPFPADRPRPAQRSWAGRSDAFAFAPALRERVERLAREARCTPMTVWLAGFQALLRVYCGQDDIVVGSVFSGRTRVELEPLVGLFANTLVLRTDLSGDPTFRELLERTAETLLGAHQHQDVPFDRVVDALAPHRDAASNPLFQLCLVYQDFAATAGPDGGGPATETVSTSSGTSRFDLVLYLGPRPDGSQGGFVEYSTELYTAERIGRLLGHLETLLGTLVAEPDAPIGRAGMLDADEHRTLVHDWNATEVAYPSAGTCLPGLVARTGVAARYRGDALTYERLHAEAGRVAGELRARGIGPEDVVGVLLDRSLDLPVVLLGILTAGAAYLPLDPQHPDARIAFQLADAGCRLVLADERHVHRVPVDTLTPADCAGSAPGRAPAPDNAAYVIYTSGSTGRPKGVVVSHANAVNYVTTAGRMFGIGPGERVLQFANPCFDVSVLDLFGALCHGATLVLADRETLHDADRLHALLRDESVTVAAIAPAMLALLDPAGLPDLRVVSAAGEAFAAEVVNRWAAPGRTFHNGYGPTETTVICVDHECRPGPEAPPIGRPLPNQRVYVLDRDGRPAPIGVPGELLVGGAGVARGYLGRPALTAQRFTPDPFGPPGARLYRTGDLAAWTAGGTLRYLGRLDDQVKIRGFRVEPGEVTGALAAQPGIAAALVVARDDGDGPRLIAYYVATGGVPAPDPAGLRDALRATLPDYLVPAAFVALPELPVGSSGKVDRRALPAPRVDRDTLTQAYVEPRTPVERGLAEVWRGLLGIDRVGVHDDFFALGGDSLRSIQLIARARTGLGLDLQVRDVFTHPTIAGLAARTARPDDSPLVPLKTTGDGLPLFCVHAIGGSVAPYLPLAAELDGPVYGLESPGLDGTGEPLTTIAEMARVYLEAIRGVVPHGPYRLAGWSLGGAVAYEMAGRLRADGEQVDLLVMLDTGDPPRLDSPPGDAEILTLFARDLAGVTGAPDPGPVPDLDTLVSTMDLPDEVRAQLGERLRVFAANARAGAVWRPAAYDGPVTLAVTGGRTADWPQAGRLTTHPVPGDHFTMLRPPHVGAVARLLRPGPL
jgi:amino acid adenylation domain-containing protein